MRLFWSRPLIDPSLPVSTPFDPSQIDAEGFLAELRAMRAEIDASLGPDDLRHLRKIEAWGRKCTALGLATCWIAPNPLSAVLLSLGRSTRWLMMHHVGHRGYDKIPEVPAKYTSRVFAHGARRFLDWPDWMRPEAWIYEHNVLHHFHTGEVRDPDLIERNTDALRNVPLSMPARYGLIGLLALTWRASYYAPNTLRAWRARHDEPTHTRTRDESRADLLALWTECYLPYAALHFAALPAMFLPLGPWAAFSAFANSLVAEALTNVHTFCVVGPNHTGDDLYRFEDRPRSKGEYFVRQVIGSVNYATGGDLRDFAHLWLNYQIEHHIWPDLPMSQYQRVQPRVKALCEKYGVPYVQQSVWKRLGKMLDVAVGRTSMRRPERAAAVDAVQSAAQPA